MLKTLNLAIEVLNKFTRQKPEWGGRELANDLEMNHTKIYRILETLDNNNFLSKDPDTKRYTLGIAVWELGMIKYDGLNVKQLLRPILEELSEQTGESVFLTILDKDEAVTLEVVEPANKVKFTVSAGSRAPLYVGASYRSILAFMPEEAIEAILDPNQLKKYTENTLVDKKELQLELERIRKQGWATSKGEYTADVIAFAVPLFDHEEILGSITVSGPTYRMTEDKTEEYLTLLKKARDQMAAVITRYQLKLKL
ncbi:IclR family transcriptional regulator [Virgibacillus sp. C22-A2]|uniref:IclR family transcriptional regulator n=1 Tax=Virgibacillus tibetensis TaxID=3042313 RepID=A0ABU6KD63_9BACI|nr:IclR family transcriptional regulator [Virgibacillus sp. C22-A2]